MRIHPSLALVAVMLISGARAEPEALHYDRVQLTATAQAEVQTDRLVVILSAQAEGKQAAAAADEVNRRIDWAIDTLQDQAEVQVQTLGYRSDAVYEKNTIRGWRVRQSLRIESHNSRLLGDLVGKLQDRLQVQSIDYQLSQESRRKHLDELTQQALQRFQARAIQVAKSLGRDDFRIVLINIHDGRERPMPMARAMRQEARAAVAPVRFETGSQQLAVSVNGEIQLSDD